MLLISFSVVVRSTEPMAQECKKCYFQVQKVQVPDDSFEELILRPSFFRKNMMRVAPRITY